MCVDEVIGLELVRQCAGFVISNGCRQVVYLFRRCRFFV